MEVTTQFLTIIGTVIATTASLAWFMFTQFSNTRREFYRVISRHNREDDENFAILEEAISNINMRNARIDGTAPPEHRKIPKRRYLVDDGTTS